MMFVIIKEVLFRIEIHCKCNKINILTNMIFLFQQDISQQVTELLNQVIFKCI